MFDIVIIGAGIVGSLIARELSKYNVSVAALEKENDVGNVTTSANSAIVHSGYDPLPGTNKAKFNVLGNKMYDQLCKDLDVTFLRIGSIAVATEDNQLNTLVSLEERAKQNGVEVKLLNAEQLREIEPNISKNAKGGLLAPTAGIVNPFTLCVHAMENAIDNGVHLFLSEEVISIKQNKEIFEICTKNGIFEAKIVINAAGLGSTKIASMIEKIDWEMTPRRGEYYLLNHGIPFTKHTIFPLPSEKGKGILVSPTTSWNFLVGPSSEYIDDADDVSTDKDTLQNIKDQASSMVENIVFNMDIRHFAGVRATVSRHDFIIEYAKTTNRFINVSGIESPGLVSAPAIAQYVVNDLVKPVIKLEENPNFNPKVKPYKKSKFMSLQEMKDNPEYGEIVCSCEDVSLGEINDVLSRSCPPHSVKGVKRRTRAGFGVCQGGFCQAKVLSILAHHYNIPLSEVPYDDVDSNILIEKVKNN